MFLLLLSACLLLIVLFWPPLYLLSPEQLALFRCRRRRRRCRRRLSHLHNSATLLALAAAAVAAAATVNAAAGADAVASAAAVVVVLATPFEPRKRQLRMAPPSPPPPLSRASCLNAATVSAHCCRVALLLVRSLSIRANAARASVRASASANRRPTQSCLPVRLRVCPFVRSPARWLLRELASCVHYHLPPPPPPPTKVAVELILIGCVRGPADCVCVRANLTSDACFGETVNAALRGRRALAS